MQTVVALDGISPVQLSLLHKKLCHIGTKVGIDEGWLVATLQVLMFCIVHPWYGSSILHETFHPNLC